MANVERQETVVTYTDHAKYDILFAPSSFLTNVTQLKRYLRMSIGKQPLAATYVEIKWFDTP